VRKILNQKGLTLLELLITVGLFGVTSLVIANVLLNYTKSSQRLENQQAMDNLFFTIGQLAGNPASILKTVNNAFWPTGTNACLRTCVLGAVKGTTADSCSSGTYLCRARTSADVVVWNTLSLVHPYTGSTVASADAGTYTRYMKNGAPCPVSVASPSLMCPFIAVTEFSALCPSSTPTCVRMHSLNVHYYVRWDTRLTTAQRVEFGISGTSQHEGTAHLPCSEILGSAVCRTSSSVDFYWTGLAGDGLWSSAANWSTNQVPSGGDTVVFDHRCSNCTATVDRNFTIWKLSVTTGFSGTNTVAVGVTLTQQSP
jgi:prepilin-type N-terminal cleavage/methylation domain-containing protein